MSKITGMASEDRRRYLCLQSTPKAEAPSSIFTVAPAPSLESPALVGPSEADLSEADPSDIIIFFI